MRFYKLLLILLVLACAVGGIATFAWWRSDGGEADIHYGHWLGAVFVTSLLTFANILIRWVKWRFLCRRNGIRVPARKGLGVYLATLPAILTPFYVGELLRIPMLGLPARSGLSRMMRIYLLERGADVLVLLMLIFVGNMTGMLILAGLFGGVLLLLRQGNRLGWSVAVLLSIPAWLLPVVSLTVFNVLLGKDAGFSCLASLFGKSTLFGGLTGLPLGAGVTGSSMLSGLVDLGISLQAAMWITAGFRFATTWFALGIGGIAAIVFIMRLRSLDKADNHFDAIADQYVDEIPEHIRDHLLRRKVDAIVDRIGDLKGKDGLDVGCGQGTYSLQFARKGARMVGVDLSGSQLTWARQNADAAGVTVDWKQASADKLPLPDARFDFVYCVNMLHHMESRDAQKHALQEMGRILRPGGQLFVHEMNPLNPLFRFYMGYLFPVLNAIDEGTEWWLHPRRLPDVECGCWENDKQYFTFIPDFIPVGLWKIFRPVECWLERSRWSPYSAHFMAVWKKSDDCP